jgi:hypothetical protein
MAPSTNGSVATSATKVLVRAALYYVGLAIIGFLAWRYMPRTQLIAGNSLEALFGPAVQVVPGDARAGATVQPVGSGTLAATVALAMTAAALLCLPVAWIYTLTRARRGYQQSVVQLLVMLPVVCAGIVVLVKYSLALAFSLGGIAAAVRFRNALEDSKDAVYVFLVTGVGIAAAVDVPVALVISFLFNVITIALWVSDFGRTPVALDGKLGERRLARAKQLARTGTFVARIDDEVLKDMSAEQLEGLAKRAWSRAREHDPDGNATKLRAETRLIVRMPHVDRIRPIVEGQLEACTKRWQVDNVVSNDDGTTVIEYLIVTKKSTPADELLSQVRASGGADPVEAHLV